MPLKDKEARKACNAKYYQENKEARKAYKAKYYQENKEAIKAYGVEYRERNRESIKIKKAKYYQENKESQRAYRAKYREEHKEEIKACVAKYRLKNSEKIKNAKKIYLDSNTETNKLLLGIGPYCSICGDRPETGLDHMHVEGNKDKIRNVGTFLQKPMSEELRVEVKKGPFGCKSCHHFYDRGWAMFNEQSWSSFERFAALIRKLKYDNPHLTRKELSKVITKEFKRLRGK